MNASYQASLVNRHIRRFTGITFAKTMAHASRVDYPSSTGAQVTDTGNLSVANGYKRSISKKTGSPTVPFAHSRALLSGAFRSGQNKKIGDSGVRYPLSRKVVCLFIRALGRVDDKGHFGPFSQSGYYAKTIR